MARIFQPNHHFTQLPWHPRGPLGESLGSANNSATTVSSVVFPSVAPKPNKFYEKHLFIRRWKHLLPDGAPWFDGFPKKKLKSTEPDYLRKFILETRRGEFSHWIQWILITGFIAWNPFPANLVIIAYAFASNVPCLVNLRHTRQRLLPALIKQL